MRLKSIFSLLAFCFAACQGQGPVSCPYGLTSPTIPPTAVYEDNITTFGELSCINYCFPVSMLPPEAHSGAEYCGRVFRDVGVNPIATWVLNNTRSNDSANYLTFFLTAEGIINNFNSLGFADLTVASFCVEAALTLLCRYVYPTCDPAFQIPTYDPICRRGCFTLQDFICKDFFTGLGIAIGSGLLDVSTIDPPICGPLEDTEAGGAPMCIDTLDGDLMPPAIQTGSCYSGKGRGYNGTISTTVSGKTCQAWVSGQPHQFLLPTTQYQELEGGHNNCRNPGNRGTRPWCFTTDPATRWEYCSIPQCAAGPQCELYSGAGKCRLYGSIGYDYIYTDTAQTTEGDFEAQIEKWEAAVSSQASPRPGETDCRALILDLVCHYYFPACDLSKSEPTPVQVCREFCSNIEISGDCATQYQQVVTIAAQFNTLLVPNCSSLPDKTDLQSQCYTNITEFSTIVNNAEQKSSICYLASDNGLTYIGTVNVSASGRPCQNWDLQLPFDVRPINSLLRRDLIGHSYCRNPEQRSDQPWCYVTTDNGTVVPENCAVPECISATSESLVLPLYAIIIIAVIGGVILVLTFSICCVLFCIYTQKKKTDGYPLMDSDGQFRLKSLDRPLTAMEMNNDHYVKSGILIPTQFEGVELPQFPRDDIVYIRDLGTGNFGLVVQAEARGIIEKEESTTVAVKVLKEGSQLQAKQDFFKEASLMHEFVHPNILRLLGVCIEQEPLCMIFEYMELGDLNNFLRKNDPKKMSGSKQNLASGLLPPSGVGMELLVGMTVDIAAGLEYLCNHHYVHRDMASRNCLVNSNMKVKIADFGLSQDVYSSDYYRLGESSLLPVRWMPPEAIIYGKFTIQSDIWSFGVVMWELYSYGQQPYFSMTNEEVCQYVRAGQVLPCPDCCPQEIYDLMLDCWVMEPNDRPTASELHTGLRRWNPDISASLSLQRNVSAQPNYQNFSVVKEFEKDEAPPRANTLVLSSASETVPMLPDKRRSYTTSEKVLNATPATTNGSVAKNLGAVEDEV